MRDVEREFMDGYLDGRDSDTPEAGTNRSAAYRHSFEVGRAEKNNDPIPAAISRAKARQITIEAGACPEPTCLGMLVFMERCNLCGFVLQ